MTRNRGAAGPFAAPLAVLLGAALAVTACTAEPVAGTTATPAGSSSSAAPSMSGAPTSAVPATSEPGPSPTQDPTDTTPATASSAGSAGPVEPVGPPETVVSGLEAPWSIAFVDGASLISERDSGRILQVRGADTTDVGTVEGVVHQGEGGLLGLATRTVGGTPYVYAYFTGDEDNRIVRYPLTGGAEGYGLGPAEPIFSGIAKAGNHNGGRIAFGPDGMLYATTGDAGQSDRSQDPDSTSGKILRLTPDGAVPADNPVPGNPMYSMGHRNPQGIAWDSQGRLWSAEFGQNTWDELNLIEPGANYGWPIVEGIADDPAFVDPLQQWPTDDASPSGIAIVDDTIFIANLKGERLRAIPVATPAESTEFYTGEYGRLRDVVVASQDAVGSSAHFLWILTNNTDGRGDPQEGDDRILTVNLTPG